MASSSTSLLLSLPPLLLLLLFAACDGSAAAAQSLAGHGGGRHDHHLLMLDRFHGWMARHGRSYPTAGEKLRRFEVYRRNVEHIESANRDGRLGYQLGENEFTDLTDEEFMAAYTGGLDMEEEDDGAAADMVITTRAGDVRESAAGVTGDEDGVAAVRDIPASVNWTEKGAVTPAKNQKKCNACWAFSAVATVESLHQITTGELLALSEQELLDCDPFQSGCRSGSPYRALRWIHDNGGITTEEDYPYLAAKGDRCNANKTNHRAAAIGRSRVVLPDREDLLALAVAAQPVSVTMDGRGANLRHYSGGVYTGPCAAGRRPNHAVALVGYGEDEATGVRYWIAKNSWGQTWGDRGFFLLRRGADGDAGLCGIARSPAYPTMG